MSLQFIIGPSGSGKTETMYREILERAAANPGKNYLILVPEQFTLQTQKDIVLKSPNHGIFNIDVLSFARLSHRIFDEAGGNDRKPLNDMGKAMILRRVARLHEQELPLIGPNMHKAGYINEVKSVISEFMQYDIRPDTLETILAGNPGRPGLQSKLRDLQVLYRGYLDFTGERYITSEDILDHALTMAPKAPFLERSEIFLDGFTGFTPVQLRFLGRLMTICTKITVTVTMGREAIPTLGEPFGEEDLFLLGKKTIRALRGLAEKNNTPEDDIITCVSEINPRLKEAPGLCYLEKYLFRKGKREPFSSPDTGIRMAQLPDMRCEAGWIGRQIHRLVREEGLRYRDIAILTADVSGYENVLTDEMKKYDIPLFLDYRRSVLLNPFTELLRSVVELIGKDWAYESIMRYLKSGMADFTAEEVHLLDRHMVACGIRRKRDFLKEWDRPLYGKEKDETYLPMINALRTRLVDQLMPLAQVIPPKRKEKCEVLIRGLYEFMVAGNAYEKLLGRKEFFQEQSMLEDGQEHNRDKALAREYDQIYREVLSLFDRMMELLGQEEMTCSEFLDVLDAGLSEVSVGIPPVSMDQVLVGDVERSRLAQVRVLFLMGVNDGRIPMDVHKRGILSEIDRQALKEQQIELSPTTREAAFTQRFYLYMYLTKPSQQLYLTYPLVNAKGEALHPSYLVGTLQRLFPKLAVEKPDSVIGEEDLMTPKEGLLAMIRALHDEQLPKALLAYFYREDTWRMLLEKILDQAFRVPGEDPIQKAVAEALYGTRLRGSVTRLEKYASCAYAYFLKYGLRLFEKEEYGFENRDLGSIYHDILKRYCDLLVKNNCSWFSVSEERAEELLEEAMEAAFADPSMQVLSSTSRGQQGMERIRRVMRRTIGILTGQVRTGSFEPKYFEKQFEHRIPLEGDAGVLELTGKIDRLDVRETADEVLVKVVDYKTGNAALDLGNLYRGLALQLMTYLNAAVRLEEAAAEGKKVERAGVLYYHIDDPLVDGMENRTDEEVDTAVRKLLKMSGLVNDDPEIYGAMDRGLAEAGYSSLSIPVSTKKDSTPDRYSKVASGEDLKMMSAYAELKMARLGEQILSGQIRPNPYTKKQGEASPSCAYCSYQSICGFRTEFGDEYRILPEMKDEDAMDAMREALEGGADISEGGAGHGGPEDFRENGSTEASRENGRAADLRENGGAAGEVAGE